jgi:hypothetical protein
MAAAYLGMCGRAQANSSTEIALGGSSPVATTTQQTGSGATAIRPFPPLNVPESELDDLRRRIKAMRWPTKELVADQSQGVQLATTQALASYWATEYDWRKVEARLNSLPQFVTEIDGQDIAFIHVVSKHDNALRLSSRTAGPARSSSR